MVLKNKKINTPVIQQTHYNEAFHPLLLPHKFSVGHGIFISSWESAFSTRQWIWGHQWHSGLVQGFLCLVILTSTPMVGDGSSWAPIPFHEHQVIIQCNVISFLWGASADFGIKTCFATVTEVLELINSLCVCAS